MKVKKTEDINFEHVKLVDTGFPLPVVFNIDVGYSRGATSKTTEGDVVALIGVSNVKADEITIDYKKQENEEITALLGLVINSKKRSRSIMRVFKNIADAMT